MIRRFLLISGVAALAAGTLAAQGPGRHPGGAGDFALMHAEFGFSNKVVTGSPYSAQAVTQFTQSLSNGDHVQRTMTATIARDSQGRTRVDRSISSVGAMAATPGGSARAVVIRDPVAEMSYALDPVNKIARSMPMHAPGARNAFQSGSARPNARVRRAASEQDLGTQTIQGVTAQGKRTTRVIAAGTEGNEKDIDIVTETWYSPDLQVIVMSKTSDPRFGDTVYQLSSVSRTEPDPALFVVPSDYKVESRPMHGPDGVR